MFSTIQRPFANRAPSDCCNNRRMAAAAPMAYMAAHQPSGRAKSRECVAEITRGTVGFIRFAFS